jgi:sec-independent protein translocase protein TatC
VSLSAGLKRVRNPLPRRPPRDVEESRMSLLDHLRELKKRVVRAALAIVAATALVGFVFYEPVFRIINHPYCSLPEEVRPALGRQGCAFIFTGPLDGFSFRIKIALIAGILLSSPVWLYQVWAFIAPGLHAKERRYTYTFVGISVLFFLTGAAVAYLVLGEGLRLLLEVGGPDLVALLDVNRYLSYVTAVLLIFGVGFEFPLVTTMLNRAGILSTQRMREWRRYIFFGMFVFAAFATPGGDPFTMLALAAPLCLLYESSILLARVRDRRRRRRDPDSLMIDTDDLDDEVTSRLDYVPAAVAPATPVGPATAVDDIT